MPELPEVETIKRQLAKKLIGKSWQGQKITGVRRRAKLLLIDFKDDSSLVFHLKLTGQLIFNGQPDKHTRHIFLFDDNDRLIFNDVRKFGWFKKVNNSQEIEKTFGPEANHLALADLTAILLKKKKAKIKAVLMDQKQIAGIGNIYSDEILFAAKIRPDRLAGDISKGEAEKILASAKQILKKAIETGGSSVDDYVDVFGKKGGYSAFHRAYQKKKCPICDSAIKRAKIGGRTAHYCPRCQV